MKILILRFSALGDVLLTTGIIHWIKQNRPEISIDVLTSTQLQDFFKESSNIENVFSLNKGSEYQEIQRSYQKLPPYDHIFDLQGNLKSSLLRFIASGKYHQIQKQSLYRRLFVKFGLFKNKLNKHVVEKYADLCLPPLNIPIPKKEDLRPQLNLTVKSKLLPNDFSNYVVVHPYASQENKVWPYFSELITQLIEQNKKVVIVGQGQKTWPAGATDLTNQTSLTELSAIISRAHSVISTDSGPMHLGVALNKPTYTLFGPTTKELGFYPDFKNCYVFENNNLDCRPCHVHGGNSCPKKHFLCMKEITVHSVLDKIKMTSRSHSKN